jgi:MoaA/NifB/PqqE/SkfB family radical SAM enzyme
MDRLLVKWADRRALNARRTWRQSRRVCHIPEKGLFFGMRGNVYSCCFNKSYVLGTYPEQSIREIWTGQMLEKQRKAIKNCDLSLGCGGCYELIKSRNINALPILNYDRFAQRNGGYPAKMDFELFNTCNLECIMCRGEFSSTIRKNREGLPPIASPYDDAFFDQVEEFIPHLKNSHFLGGEPFLIPQYVDLWERMAAINPQMSVSIQTNCTVLNQRVKDLLERMDFHISVSIDSIEPDNYARIRKHGQLDRVLENLRYFRDYTRRRGTLLTMAFCPMPQNWHELPSVIDFCNAWEMPLMFTTVESPPECSLSPLSSAKLQEIETFLQGHFHPQNTPLQRQNRQSYQDQITQIAVWRKAAAAREQAGLSAPAQNFDEFIAQIEATLVAESGHSALEAKAIAADIRQKLEFILDKAAEHGQRESATSKMIATAPSLVIRSVPGLQKEELLALFQSFVMPIA